MPQNTKHHSSMAAPVIGALFLLIGAAGIVGAWGAYRTDTNIERNGQSAQARLVKKLFLRAPNGDSDYMLEYWFETPDGRFDVSRSVDKQFWDSVQAGQLIEVKYSKSNPKRNFPAGAGVTAVGVTVFVSTLALVFAIFGGWLIWGYMRRARPAA